MVSEFADRGAVVCGTCGTPLRDPGRVTQKSALTFRKRDTGDFLVTAQSTVTQRGPLRRSLRHQTKRKRARVYFAKHLLNWLLFAVLAGIMAYLRYGGGLSPQNLALFRRFGPWVLLGFHLLVVLEAFRDSVFQGILCLIIPLYSVYYLFLLSDQFLLRSIVAGTLVGIGEDGFWVLRDLVIEVTTAVESWIRSGG